MSDRSPILKVAMAEIRKVLETYDIAGCVYLADGQGHGEYMHHITEPSWSMMRDLSRPDKPGEVRMHAKLYAKTKPVETNRTVNAMLLLGEMVGQCALNLIEIGKRFVSAIEIEKEPGRFL